jgi:YjbE family integral membrane protein
VAKVFGMELGVVNDLGLNLDFLGRLVSIIMIDLILAGDNAVVIAMAVRSLPREQRRKGIIFGAGAAVLLRVACTFFVSQLLQISFIKLVGGAVILWIAVKLFVEGAPEEGIKKEAVTISQAIRTIVIADMSMSVDNMLAVGGASGGSVFLLLFGLGLSIPFIVLTSNLLSTLMDRYPVIIYIGAAILGKVGGEMMITDPVVVGYLEPGKFLQYSVEAIFAIAVIVAGKLLLRWKFRSEESEATESTTAIPPESTPVISPEKE